MRDSLATRIGQALGIIAVVAVAWSWTGAADGAELVAKLVSASGPVEIRPTGGGAWRAASEQTVLQPGDMVRTGPGGAAEVAFVSGVVRMDENTIIVLPPLQAVRASTGNLQGPRLFLEGGRALFRVFKDRLQGTFDVITPSIIGGVKGTTFGVEQGPNLGVIVFEGVVGVGLLGRPDLPSLDVRAGQYTIMSNGQLTAPRAFVPGHPSPVWNGGPTRTTSNALPVSADERLTPRDAMAKASKADGAASDPGTGASSDSSGSNGRGPGGNGPPGLSAGGPPGLSGGGPPGLSGGGPPGLSGGAPPGLGGPPWAGKIPPGHANGKKDK
jgi:hypothetical protein